YIRINSCYYNDEYSQLQICKELEEQIGTNIWPVKGIDGFFGLDGKCRIVDCKAYKEGKIFGIDLSSGIAVYALDIHPNDHILDLCCAPGAKLCMISNILGTKGSGTVTGVDISRDRAATCRSLLKKYKISRARLFVADGITFNVPAPSFLEPIIQMISKNEQHKLGENYTSASKGMAEELARTNSQERYDNELNDKSQKRIKPFWAPKILRNDPQISAVYQLYDKRNLLKNGWSLLKPGGILVYSTCSLSYKQNEDVIGWFLSHFPNSKLEPIPNINNMTVAPLKKSKYVEVDISNAVRFDPIYSNTSALIKIEIIDEKNSGKKNGVFKNSVLFKVAHLLTKLLEDLRLTGSTISSQKVQKFSNEEKFLTFLPHSGFNNQFLSLRNAIILSYLTNRTLIMPSIIIDKKITHSGFKKLYNKLKDADTLKKARLSCPNQKNTATNKYCNNRYKSNDKFSMMYWDELMDFTILKKHIRIINRGHEFSLDTLKKSVESIYYVRETKRYGFQYFDMNNTTQSLGSQYERKFFISELTSRPETLIHFGSLHGSRRIVLDDEKSQDFLNELKRNLRFNHSKLKLCVEKIINELGGTKNYIGVHIRTGEKSRLDEMFRIQVNDTIDTIFEQVNYYSLNGKLNVNTIKCQHPIIYVATDTSHPDQTFKNFYSKYSPCIFSLKDFKHHLNIFDDVRTYNNYTLKRFFTPLVDLLVASNGGYFVGTRKSTFSKVAQEIHDFQIM
ncbi:8034_t:CDS:2, partial [Cetraspora pellucida]